MDSTKFNEMQERVFDRVRAIGQSKGLEYADDDDRLADFKEVAAEVGLSPLEVWHVYVRKHERAIAAFIREGATKSEAIEDRILDVIVYHLLLMALASDLENEKDRLGAERVHGVRCRSEELVGPDGSRELRRCCLDAGHTSTHRSADAYTWSRT